MTEWLAPLAAAVRERSGIALRPRQFGTLRSAFSRAAPGLSGEDAMARLHQPDQADELVERVVDELTVKETFFMREVAELRALDWPALVAAAFPHRVRVWSAGCATGEEAYTIVMLAREALHSDHPPVSVLGTDISESALERAQLGSYDERALRRLDDDSIRRCFRREDGRFAIRRELRDLVSFRRHNLARDAGPPSGERPFDVIVCRNVLIYLDDHAVRHAVAAMDRARRPDGTLLLGSADRLCVPRDLSPAGAPATAAAGTARRFTRREAWLPRAVAAAGEGRLESAVAAANRALADDPLSAEAYFLRATAELALDQPRSAVTSLRAALYARPDFLAAAFQLGRAHEAAGDPRSARRAYERTLRLLDETDAEEADLPGGMDPGNVAVVCAARIRTLAAVP